MVKCKNLLPEKRIPPDSPTRFTCFGPSQCFQITEVPPSVSHLSGEQVELFPVDTLVSMLSELSRLSVSYAGPPAGGAWWCRMEWCTIGAAGAGNGSFNWEWELCSTPQWHCGSISSLGFSSVVRNLESSHVWSPRQMHKETNLKSSKTIQQATWAIHFVYSELFQNLFPNSVIQYSP